MNGPEKKNRPLPCPTLRVFGNSNEQLKVAGVYIRAENVKLPTSGCEIRPIMLKRVGRMSNVNNSGRLFKWVLDSEFGNKS